MTDEPNFSVTRLTPADKMFCATIMSTSEPWITLKRTCEDCLRVASDPSRDIFIVTVNGDRAGFISLSLKGGIVGYIHTICIAPEHRNRGLGTRLLKWAEAHILERLPNVFLCVSSFNPGARRLYERLGYERVGDLKDYFITGLDEILMRKKTVPVTAFVRKSNALAAGPEQHKEIIRRYYDDLWNRWDHAVAAEILSKDFTFRGSLGVSVNGIEGFLGYVELVRAAFPDFHNEIVEMVAEGNRVAARLKYTGTHRGEIFGIPATGKSIEYSGAAFFRFSEGRLCDGWVLGDKDSLLTQLRSERR